MSLLTMIQKTARIIGLTRPSVVITSTDETILQLLEFAQMEGSELCENYDWNELQALGTFTLVAAGPFTGNLVSGSAVVTGLSSIAGIVVGQVVTGSYIPVPLTRVASIDGPSQITLSAAATSAATGATLNFGQDQYSFATDYNRFLEGTQWDRSQHWELFGPLSPQEWELIKSGVIASGPRRRFRVFGNPLKINIDPPPVGSDNGKIMAYEYVSGNWCQSAAGVGQTAWTADTDTGVLDENLMEYGVRWRWLQSKGLPYADLRDDYEKIADRKSAQTGGNRILSLTRPRAYNRFISSANAPDTGFGPR